MSVVFGNCTSALLLGVSSDAVKHNTCFADDVVIITKNTRNGNQSRRSGIASFVVKNEFFEVLYLFFPFAIRPAT
jgi:hypothetical protein